MLLASNTDPPAGLKGDPGKFAAGSGRTAAVVALDSQQSLGRIPAAIKRRAREQKTEKKQIFNAR